MSSSTNNQIILLVCLLLVGAGGTYLTYFRQQSTINDLEAQIKEKQRKRADLESMYEELIVSEQQFEEAARQWQARYKIFPDTLSSPEMVAYLTDLTQTGFDQFDIAYGGVEEGEDYSIHSFDAQGTASFYHLYRFLWKIENNRPFYRVQNLNINRVERRTTDEETGRTSMEMLASFQLEIEGLFGGAHPEEEAPQTVGTEEQGLPVARANHRPPLPPHVLPRAEPGVNPFYPVILDEVPPNEEGRLNFETANLVAIVDDKAIFDTDEGTIRLQEGDQVYLGRIIEVDPQNEQVRARLNKGGIVDVIERGLGKNVSAEERAGRQ